MTENKRLANKLSVRRNTGLLYFKDKSITIVKFSSGKLCVTCDFISCTQGEINTNTLEFYAPKTLEVISVRR